MVRQPIFNGVTPLHILWFVFMVIMLSHLLPVKKLSMARRKANKEWEIVYARHPERFWHGSNKTLKCSYCKDKTCMAKRKVSGNKNYEETDA